MASAHNITHDVCKYALQELFSLVKIKMCMMIEEMCHQHEEMTLTPRSGHGESLSLSSNHMTQAEFRW